MVQAERVKNEPKRSELPVIDARTFLEHLPPDDCWDLLTGAEVGRIGVIVEGAPEIFPLNFVVDDRTIVFRTDSGNKLLGLLHNPAVCLEIDDVDLGAHSGWSVLVKGAVAEITDPEELRRAAELPLPLWSRGEKSHLMRITPAQVTGRRLPRPTAAAR